MKNLFTALIMTAMFAAASVSADGRKAIDHSFTFAGVKPLPEVTEVSPSPRPSAETQDDFNRQISQVTALKREKKNEDAARLLENICVKFADSPRLLETARFDLACVYREIPGRSAAAAGIFEELAKSPASLLSSRLAHIYMLLSSTYERDEDWQSAVKTKIKWLATPGRTTNEIVRLRSSIISDLGRRLGEHELAAKLALECFDDDTLPVDSRASFGISAANELVASKRDSEATNVLNRTLALPAAETFRRRAAGDFIRILRLGSNASREAAEKLCLRLIADTTFSANARSSILRDLVQNRRDMRDTSERTLYSALAEKFIEENMSELSAQELGALRKAILDVEIRCGKARAEQALKCAFALMEETNMPPAMRTDAALYVSTDRLTNGSLEEAEKILKDALGFDNLGNDNVARLFAAIGELYFCKDDLNGALKAFSSAADFAKPGTEDDMRLRIAKLRANALVSFDMPEEAIREYLAVKDNENAAKLAENYDKPLAIKLYRQIISDDSRSTISSLEAWSYLYSHDRETAAKHTARLAADENTARRMIDTLEQKMFRGSSSYAYLGNYEDCAEAYVLIREINARKKNPTPLSFKATQYAINALAALGRLDDIKDACGAFLEDPGAASPLDVFQIALTQEVASMTGDVNAMKKRIALADAKLKGNLAPQDRVERINRIGCAVNIGGNENLTRAIAEYIEELYVPVKCKTYTVKYSYKPILGVGSFDTLAPQPEKQLMDRKYGGNMDFLVTDVATGDRGENIGSGESKNNAQPPSLQIAMDAVGIHFRFEHYTDDARKIEAGLTGSGSYEGYLAPGENQPYICSLFDIAPNAQLRTFNTTYNTIGHRRVLQNSGLTRSETIFTDKSAISYFMISWNAYAELIPDNGTVWDFENILWNTEGGASWNGTESIHGRSTWGRIKFDMPKDARLEIIKRVIAAALAEYNREKRTSHHYEGIIDKWKDPEVGDPKFYDECVKPLIEKLDTYIPMVTVDMTDDDILRVATEALPAWRNIRFLIGQARAEYLRNALSE